MYTCTHFLYLYDWAFVHTSYLYLAKNRKIVTLQDGVTPLMYAAKRGLLQVTKTLVEYGQAEVNIAEKVKGTFYDNYLLQNCAPG